MKTIAVQNAKGGIGKTTTSVHLAGGFAMSGLRVLLIDTDPQASIKSYFKIKLEKGNTLDFIMGTHHEDCTYKIQMDMGKRPCSFDIMPSSQRMQDFDDKTAGIPRREEILKFRAEEGQLQDSYDVVVIDCPPTLNLAIKNVLTFADYLLIPAEMEGMSITGIHTVLQSVEFISKYTQIKPKILGVLPTKYDQRQKISRSLFESLEKLVPNVNIFEPIRIDAKIKKAFLQKRTLFECDPETRASKEYLALIKELLKEMDLLNTVKSKKNIKTETSSTISEKVMEL